ncbi:MAG: HAMP domain-containing histidine kinase, partial [Bacteroidetes bacterium]|nr:HAMP domain-containing histidine kinase [Bacteroidota bacterium]
HRSIRDRRFNYLAIGSLVYIVCIRIIPIYFHIPKFLFEFNLFNPVNYANNNLFASLGDYILNILVVARVLYLIIIYIKTNKIVFNPIKTSIPILFFFLKVLVLTFILKGIVSLIIDSSISVDINKHNLNSLSVVLLGTIALTVYTYILFADLVNMYIYKSTVYANNKLVLLCCMAVQFCLLYFVIHISWIYALCIIVFVLIHDWIFYSKSLSNSQKKSFVIPVICAILVGLVIYDNNTHKENELKKLMAESLMNSTDFRIEQILPEIDKKIGNDVKISEFLWSKELLQKYLKSRYFSGYMNRYDLNIYISDSTQNVLLSTIDTIYNRQSYKIAKTNFVKTNISLPIIGYIGKYEVGGRYIYIAIQKKNFEVENVLYEILSEVNYTKESENEFYSWAIYKHGKLFNSHGLFNYPIYIDAIKGNLVENENIKLLGWIHTLFNEKSDLNIILSKESDSVSKPVSYIGFFITFFILFFLGIMFLELSIKLREVKSEVEKIIQVREGYVQLESLNELVNPISEIYQTDLNIFDGAGNLIYSSQPRIFESGIMSSKINENSIRNFYILGMSQLIQNEHLGKLEYLSAYTPLMVDNKLIGYLNLPYFTKQAELSEAIKTNLISLITPYTFIFILIGILSWFITSSFVRRLNFIREKISNTVLGKKNPKIKWHSKDEIGDLVKQYNVMVDKLAKSAETLAKNERNEAWREMAKQIAHEIKNPLTPMKLNLQLLQRANNDNHPNKDEIMSKVNRVLIEQIDALANLATEFSNFAKMPESKNEIINICSIIDDMATLFISDEKVTINYNSSKEEYYIKADSQEIKRVLTNLIKNAIQAIPEDRDGVIDIAVNAIEDKMLQITIKDNGQGIEDELKDKIFVPNFSTKNSGMGLGLAMVKKIIEQNNGEIRFESVIDEGTTFYITLPLVTV